MSNTALVSHLRMIAQLMVLDCENHFKVMAFQNAAESIDGMAVDVSEENLHTIHGVGNSISEVIRQFMTMGSSTRLIALSQRWPIEALTMTKVHGVGPKTAMKLHREGYRNLAALLEAAKAGKIANPKLRQSILATEGKSRVPFVVADQLAKYISSQMIAHVERLEVCGSIRRQMPDIKDIDIVAMVKDTAQAQKTLGEFAKLGDHVTSGDKRGSIRATRYGVTMNCDLWLTDVSNFGSYLNHVTGSREHNIKLRTLARNCGLLVSEYGVFKNGVKLGGEDEHDLYRILEIPFVEPQNRI